MYHLPSSPSMYYHYPNPYMHNGWHDHYQYHHHQHHPSYYPSHYHYHHYHTMPYWHLQRDTIVGKASWTWGGMPTKCEIPWKTDNHMTVAVGETSPFKCGQKLKVKNISFVPQREVTVTVVDQVKTHKHNQITLHRKAFEALGVNPTVGMINVEITPINQES